jgi:O-antigen ligase
MPKRKRVSISPSQGAIAAVMALWLLGIFVAAAFSRFYETSRISFFFPSNFEAALIQVAGISWPLLYFLFSAHRFFPKHPPVGVLISTGIFFLFAGLSTLVSSDPYLSIGYLISTFLAIWVVLQFNTHMMAADFDKAFKIYSILIGLSLVVYAVFVYTPNVRLGQDEIHDARILNPNAIAMVCMSGFIGAFAFQNLMVKIIFLGINATILIMTGSRTATVGAIVAVVVFLWSRRKEWRITRVILFWLVVLYLLTIVVIWWNPLISPIKTFFALHDRSRGLATWGGRFLPWQETWSLFLSHPLFGVGYRAHEELLQTASSAHNGYLAMLAEIGVIGSAALIYPVWKGITFLRLKNTFDPAVSYAVLISLCIAYLYVAIFERYLISLGNPTSFLFLVAVFSYLIPYGERLTWRSSPKIGRHVQLPIE